MERVVKVEVTFGVRKPIFLKNSWWGVIGDDQQGKPKLVKLAETQRECKMHSHAQIVSPMAREDEDGTSVFMIGMCHLDYDYFIALFEVYTPDGAVRHYFCEFGEEKVLNPIDAGEKPFEWFATKAIEMGGSK